PGGRVEVRVSSSENAVELVVRDEGPGLTDEVAARAFEPYFHGPASGPGLGLTIAREIVEAHAGRIWLKSRPGGGAEARFVLPTG
ncbi:MAG: ATP-binding protein, partial [Anaerolineae bacterium]